MRKATAVVLGLLLAVVAATLAQAEPIRAQQWHLDAMKADDLWRLSTGKGVTVAVIDTGIGRIPELEGQVLPGKDFAPDNVDGDERSDYDNHGTAMAALIAGSGRKSSGDGSFGLAPDAQILPLRVPHEVSPVTPSWVTAIRYAADSKAKIINLSLGLSSEPKEDHDRFEAVKYALSKGKLIFAAVGNDGDAGNRVSYPATTPGVVGVGAVDASGVATKESVHGPQVDMAAPGIDIVTACAGKTGLCKSHGTSDATALASASAALLWSAHPDWTNNQVLRVLLNTAGKPVDGVARNDYVGYGIVRPRVALPTPGDPGPADVYPLPDLAAAEAEAKSPPPSLDTTTPRPVAQEGDGSTLPWLALGIGACLLIGGAVAVAALVRRASR
ncbi:type VII secretion-associated serine protease mycosin [Streptomyces sp. NPDC060031]|uniref:type VII secretion-associated serine protease mycosin n=1 Tax=Streptomyces sp. NPDC060031 TaxID=3347043 RepID=UPI0036C5268D